MKRRSFFKLGSLAALGTTLVNPMDAFAENNDIPLNSTNKKAKNIVFMVSDGMSSGTLNQIGRASCRERVSSPV